MELVAITPECPLFAKSYQRRQELGAMRIQIYKILVRKDLRSPNCLCFASSTEKLDCTQQVPTETRSIFNLPPKKKIKMTCRRLNPEICQGKAGSGLSDRKNYMMTVYN